MKMKINSKAHRLFAPEKIEIQLPDKTPPKMDLKQAKKLGRLRIVKGRQNG